MHAVLADAAQDVAVPMEALERETSRWAQVDDEHELLARTSETRHWHQNPVHFSEQLIRQKGVCPLWLLGKVAEGQFIVDATRTPQSRDKIILTFWSVPLFTRKENSLIAVYHMRMRGTYPIASNARNIRNQIPCPPFGIASASRLL